MRTCVVADDHALVRQGVIGLLQQDGSISVVGAATNGSDAMRLVRELRPDVLVIDQRMPGGPSGTDVAQELSRDDVPTRVLIVSASDHPFFARHALQSGAAGHVSKGADPRELVTAVHTVAGGGTYLSPTMTTEVLAPDFQPLNERAFRVLELVRDGLTNQQIATQLHVSHDTIKDELSRLMRLFGVHNRAELVARALEERLIA